MKDCYMPENRSMSKQRPFRLLFISCISLLIVTACSQSPRLNHGLIGRLKGRGPVALSSDNPFLAANLLLSKEMERSADLKGFINHRGAPSALSIEHSTFKGLTFKLYYPENREYFNLEELDDTWLINGPLPMPAEEVQDLARIAKNKGDKPSILMPDKEKNADDSEPITTPATEAKSFSSFSSADEKKQHADLSAEKTEGPSSEAKAIRQIVARSAKSPAELTPRGDLVHFVTYAGETLALISRWYTEDLENAGKIARINNLAKPSELKLGDQIVVPAYLLRNKLRLTEEGLKALQELVWKKDH